MMTHSNPEEFQALVDPKDIRPPTVRKKAVQRAPTALQEDDLERRRENHDRAYE